MDFGLRRVGWFSILLMIVVLLDSFYLSLPGQAPLKPTSMPPAEVQLRQLQVQLALSDGSPAQGALLEISRAQGRMFAQAQSFRADEAGKVEMQLRPGRYVLLARASGQARLSASVDVQKDGELSLQFSPAHQLQVEVLGESGALENATVLLQSSNEESAEVVPFGAATDALGNVRFESLPAPPYRVQIFAAGYQSYEASISDDLLVRLERSSGLRVRVTEGGVPVDGAEVTLAGAALWPARKIQVDKEVLVTGLNPGRYALYAEKAGKISPVERNVELSGGGGEVSVELKLQSGKFLSVSVVDDEEQPVAGAHLTWSEMGIGLFTRTALSNEAGIAQLGPLLEYEGQLSVTHAEYVSTYVDVDSTGAQEVRLRRGGRVVGRVVDANGRPVAGATAQALGLGADGAPIYVTFRSSDVTDAHFSALAAQNILLPAGELGVMIGPVPPLPLGQVTGQNGQLSTGDDGRFEIIGVPPGSVQVFCRHPDFLEGKSEVFELQSGQTHEVEIVLGEGLPFFGRVLDERDFPVAGAMIRASASDFQRTVYSAEDGTFSFSAAPKKLKLQLSRAEAPLIVALETFVEASRDERVIHLPPLREASTIRILDESGDPLPLVKVHFESTAAREPRSLTRFTSDEGEVELPGLVGLQGTLRLELEGKVAQRLNWKMRPEQQFEMKAALVVRGEVRGVRGRLPAPDAEVLIEQAGRRFVARTDEFGVFQILGLARGAVQVHASHPEYGKANLRTVLGAGDAERPFEMEVIELSPPLLVRGKVVDEAGKAWAGAWIAESRVSAFQPLGGPRNLLGVSDEEGNFEVEVTAGKSQYLYAALPGVSAGFGDKLPAEEESRDYVILLDRLDRAGPAERGTLLLTLQEGARGIEIYALAAGSSFDLKVGDRILKIEGEAPGTIEKARQLLSGEPGSEVLVEIERQGKRELRRVKRTAYQRAAQ